MIDGGLIMFSSDPLPSQPAKECFDQVVLLATGGFLVYSGAVAESVTYFTQARRGHGQKGNGGGGGSDDLMVIYGDFLRFIMIYSYCLMIF